MALPLSGTLTMNQIRTELGIPSQAPFSLDTAENGGYVALNPCSPYQPSSGNPASISEWYGYNHTINCCGGSPCYTHTGWAFSYDCASACAGPFTGSVYSCCATLGVNCSIAVNGTNCQPYYPAISGYLSNGTVCYTVNGNVLDSVANCAGATTTTTTAPPTTTTTTVPPVCHNFIATATGVMVWTDCCGVNQNQFLIVGDTFCAQVGTVFGSWLDQGTNCNC